MRAPPLSAADLEHALRPRYVDSERERASLCILREIGVVPVALDAAALPDGRPLAPALLAEHTRSDATRYAVSSGRVLLDVRDAGDAWVRVLLSPGVALDVDGPVSRRFVPDATLPAAAALVLHEQPRASSAIVPRFHKPSDALETVQYHSYRALICELCRQFYAAGWVTGTGGSISVRYGNRIYMTPSGVQKERISPDELYLLDLDGAILDAPSQKPGTARAPKLSDCSPLFLHAYRLRGAGAVLHSHGLSCNMVTALCDGQREFRISHQEMIKGLAGHGYHDELVIPIIENTARESELAESLAAAIAQYPKASAVLVRRHGIYVWGDSWESAKRHGECLHYLFEVALAMHKLGIDWTVAPPPVGESAPSRKRLRAENEKVSTSLAAQHKYVLLDIEGTTTPITFVHDVLFPYAKHQVQDFLTSTWETPATHADVQALRQQAEADQHDASLTDVPRVAGAAGAKDAVIASLVAYVHWNIAADRKIPSLKSLQGHIWDVGYTSGTLQSTVYDDVPDFLSRMAAQHVRVGIYSSGSRGAQRALFQYSNHGDLRPLLSVYFDTKVGQKREAESYKEILLSLGVDSGKDVLFVTDVIQEAEAARAAGLDAVLSVRPGNAPLPADHAFQEIRSFAEL
jgi:methylthioribulose 1-phosphate dehydratase / enolase-phosphatase E1